MSMLRITFITAITIVIVVTHEIVCITKNVNRTRNQCLIMCRNVRLYCTVHESVFETKFKKCPTMRDDNYCPLPKPKKVKRAVVCPACQERPTRPSTSASGSSSGSAGSTRGDKILVSPVKNNLVIDPTRYKSLTLGERLVLRMTGFVTTI